MHLFFCVVAPNGDLAGNIQACRDRHVATGVESDNGHIEESILTLLVLPC